MLSQISSLFHPGGVLGGVIEYHLMGWIMQKRGAAFHRLQNATLAFNSQRLWGNSFALSHPLDQRLGLMDVQVVHHQVPPGGLPITGNQSLDVDRRIPLGARWSPGWLDDLTRHDIKIDEPGKRP